MDNSKYEDDEQNRMLLYKFAVQIKNSRMLVGAALNCGINFFSVLSLSTTQPGGRVVADLVSWVVKFYSSQFDVSEWRKLYSSPSGAVLGLKS